jgi:hypothetical protein
MRVLTRSSSVRSGGLFVLVVSLALVVLAPHDGVAQSSEPYNYFRTLSQDEKATFQLKLNYAGPVTRPVPSVILHAVGQTADVRAFDLFRGPGTNSFNDEFAASAGISAGEIDAIISNVGLIPAVTDGVWSNGHLLLSFAMTVKTPSIRGFDSQLNDDESQLLFDQLRNSLVFDSQAYRLVQRFACKLGLLEKQRPHDATASVQVTFSGLRREANTDRFVGTARIRNTSQSAIPAPISLVLIGLRPETPLLNESGVTCGTEPRGMPYVNVGSLSDALEPGRELEIKVEFSNEYLLPLGGCHCEDDPTRSCDAVSVQCPATDQCICTPTPKVLAGPGAR